MGKLSFIDRFHIWRRKLRWNKQYRQGRWDNLKNDIERVRYEKIIDFIAEYGTKNPKILDLGSGEGIMCERLNPENYSLFVGMDFSSVSIDKANQKELSKSKFITADLHNYQPNQTFDIIIFNEAFYYIHDLERENVLNTMINSLDENGIIITSIYREGTGCWEYFEKDRLKKLDFTIVTTNEEKTYWKIGVYQKVQ